jgi:hypothetical protein
VVHERRVKLTRAQAFGVLEVELERGRVVVVVGAQGGTAGDLDVAVLAVRLLQRPLQ